MADLKDISSMKDYILQNVKNDIAICEDYAEDVIKPCMKNRYDAYYASEEYYNKKYPILSKKSGLVDTSVADTIEWALPALVKLFFGAETPVIISGVGKNDDKAAKTMNDLIQYQITRKNNAFLVFYNWFKDALLGFGIVKCLWDRETAENMKTEVVSYDSYNAMTNNPSVQILGVEPADLFGNVRLSYLETYYKKNNPKLENILISEFLFPPNVKDITDSPFVAHKKRVTLSYLYQRAKDGIYANVDKIHGNEDIDYDEIEQDLRDNHTVVERSYIERARTEVMLYECYTKLDLDGDGILEDLIVTVCEDVILRVEKNPFGRHPFFILSPVKDPHRVFARRGIPEMVGQLQDLKTALIRQMVINIGLTNDPRLIMSEEAINIDDYINGKAVIRKKSGYAMSDVVQAMPVQPLHPWTFQFLEYVEGQKEARTGITRYNQGLDGSSLNKMLALDTPIPLADGSYKLNKDIVKGDMVIGSDGKPVKVLVAHPIQNPDRAFKITFKSGDVIRAGGEHRWSVKVCDKHYRYMSPKFEKLPTFRIFDLISSGHKVYIPRVGKVDFTEKDLPLDPYVFGLWLGDGNSHTNRFTTMDNEIMAAFSAWSTGFYGGHIEKCGQQHSGKATTYSIVNTPFRRILKDLHCLKDSRYGEYDDNLKHIPDIYLQGSFEQRLALLQGLMDTGGCIDKNGNAIFCNSEPALVDTVSRLIESLGGKPNVNWKKCSGNKFKNARPHAHITFALEYCPVKLPRKIARWKTNAKYWEKQSIVSIEEIPVEPMRCLTVDADDELYCCGKRLTLTSNTATGISAIMNASNQRLDLIARMFKETGIRELYRFLIGLNQKFVDQNVVIRVADKELTIIPDDLNGDIDLEINANAGISAKEQTMQYLQTMMTCMLQLNQAGIQISTPTNFYNIMKRWIDEAGVKSSGDYVTDPAVIQQRAIIEMQMRTELLQTLPFEIQQEYFRTGMINPTFLASLPANIQQVLVGETIGQRQTQSPSGQGVSGEFGGAGAGISGGLGTGVQGEDNRKAIGLPYGGIDRMQGDSLGTEFPQE